jgi:predicted RNA binding protein YcfA (HicA-like mRNA interferase family)
MSKLPLISGRDCVQALQRVGFVVVRQRGSDIFMARDEPFASVTVPNHKEIKPGTLRSVIRQAGLTVDEFLALL